VFIPSENGRTACDIYSQSPHHVGFRLGQEVIFFDILKLRCGVTFIPTTLHLGVGLRVRDFEFDWAYIGHDELGGSTQFGLIYMR